MSYSKISTNISEATRFISEGRVVAVPTGTTYGLAVDTQQGFALQRIRNLKKRLPEKTFTIFMSEKIYSKYLILSQNEKKLLQKYSQQALTLLVKPKENLEHLAKEGLVGLRIIDHPLMQQLADASQIPLTATSANISGEDACLTPKCVQRSFPGKIDSSTYDLSLALILDGGQLPPNPPSTITKIIGDELEIIRQGAIKPTLTF